jgi:uncharacterized protein (TIGR04255 family)
MASEREIYSNAPVVLVALEVRHPNTGSLSQNQQRSIKSALASDLPIHGTGQLTKLEGVFSETSTPSLSIESFPKYFSRDKTISASFRETAIVLETTRYLGWDRLSALAIRTLEARIAAGGVDGVERLGIRFVNEIRVPSPAETDWADWLDVGLLGPTEVVAKLNLPIARSEGLMLFNPKPEFSVVLRYGLAEGYAVDPGGDLKRPTSHTPGPFFLVDIDSFWTPSDEIPEFNIDQLMDTADALHTPIDELFEGLITHRLRDEVLRHGRS